MTPIVAGVSTNTPGAIEPNTLKLDGGPRTVIATADSWNGATVTLYASADGGTTWVPLLDSTTEATTFTQNGVAVIPGLCNGLLLGAKVTGAGSDTSNITVKVL
jgi:hypothetical protein